MDFSLSADQVRIRDSAREFTNRFVKPVARRYDEAEAFPLDVCRLAFEHGLTTSYLPAEYGGLGLSAIELALIAEEMATGCSAIAASALIHFLPITMLLKFGTEEQRRRFLPPFARELTFASFAATEASSGQDIAHGTTRAIRDGSGWRISGEKQYITNATHASFFVVIAGTDEGVGAGRVSVFIVPAGTAGLRVSPPVKKLGFRASDTCSVFFDEVRVDEGALVGKEGDGFDMVIQTLTVSRTMIGAIGVGLARSAQALAIETGRHRKRWSQTLLLHEHYLLRLGRMEADINAARLLVHRAAWQIAVGEDAVRGASMAKMVAADVAMATATEVVEMLGGMGYTRELPAEKMFRDAKLLQIFEGPTTIQQRLIAMSLLSQDEEAAASRSPKSRR